METGKLWDKGFCKVACFQSMKDTGRRVKRVIFSVWAQLVLGSPLPLLSRTLSGPWLQILRGFEDPRTKTERVCKKKRRKHWCWSLDSNIGFWWNKRGLLGVIKPRCLCGEVSVPIASEDRLWGCFCVIQHPGIANCSPGAGSSG